MIPSTFAYEMPHSAGEAVDLMRADPLRARLLSGGTWVVPEMNRGESRPGLVVDLRRAGLSEIRAEADRIVVGATCTYATILKSTIVARQVPLLALMARAVTGGQQIHNQGTIGGSVCAALPHSDAPAAVTALAARAVIAGADGERRIAASAMFAGPGQTALEPGEVLTALEFPARTGFGHGYYKLKGFEGSWPIATAAAMVAIDSDGRCSAVALAMGGVAATPMSVDLTDVLGDRPDDDEVLARAGQRAAETLDAPWSDIFASDDYRAAVAPTVARRALKRAIDDARRATASHDGGPR
ncbi:MAG TPA: FAD binding domain-containing protein [Pseudonocardiaceae bacterium]|jgi:carbon-monoxide dehydrogenase medium subunit